MHCPALCRYPPKIWAVHGPGAHPWPRLSLRLGPWSAQVTCHRSPSPSPALVSRGPVCITGTDVQTVIRPSIHCVSRISTVQCRLREESAIICVSDRELTQSSFNNSLKSEFRCWLWRRFADRCVVSCKGREVRNKVAKQQV